MIQRIVLLKLGDEHATDAGRAEVVAKSHEVLPGCRGVVGVDVALPADPRARKDWDVCLTLRFERIADVEPYLVDPVHRAFVDEVLGPRVEVIKAWNFEIQ